MVTFNEAMLSNDRALAIRVGDFTSENIKSANFKYGYITGDDFTPGGTYAGTASILFTSIVESFKKLDVVYPEIGLLVGSKVEWVKMGKYYIDDIKIDRNANTTEIELMDEMFKLNESFKTDLKYPAQIRDVILEIATKTGVTLASDNFGMTAIQQHVSQPTGDKLTFRDVLGQVSQLLGFSCFFNRNGELEVRGLTESGITITADNYFLHGLEKSEVEYQIAGITCEVTNNEKLTVGLQTGRSLEIENPLATQDTLNLLYYALKDIVYYPYDLSYQGHLKLDVGQWVTIKTNKDETLKVPVLYQSFSFSGGLTSTISADSVAGSDAQYTYGSFVTKKIDQKSTQIQAEVQQQLKYADEEFKKVSNEMLQQSLEYQNSVRNELATSKAELETQIDTAKTQAESNAKAYADEINQATAEVAKQANTAANSLKSDLAKVKTDLTATTSTANAAKTSASEAKQQLTTVANDLSTAKQDLQAQASQLTAQASAQSELTKRVSTVEETANGTKTTVSELSKTVDSNTKNITSVTARTKTVEDDLTSTKTTLSQVKTTADSTSQKTATLETGLNGVKADLAATTVTADTTKTNLANYQASNDKAVANLQSNLQTANGNISSLQTKVEAVPGQITSAVSAVEGKIPTEIGSANLLRNTAVKSDNLKYFPASNTSVIVDTQAFKITSTETKSGGVVFVGNKNIYNLIKDRDYTFGFWILANKDKAYNYNTLGHIQVVGESGTTSNHTVPVYSVANVKANVWTRVYCTFKATATAYFRPYFLGLKSGDEIHIRDLMLNEGKVPLTYTPAVEDDITKLNTTLTQTANGLKQLSTQVTSQGSTITSHTNSINSLTTGLSAKVSQTDFNTLSGRVTTAENNITAKANELSSKITSVEEKIPTSVGGRNLVRGTANFSSGWAWNTKVATITDIIDKFNVYHGTSTGTDTASNNYDVRFNNALTVLPDTEYTLSFWVKGSGTIYSHFFPSCVAYGINSDGKTTTAADGFITHTLKSNWERYWITWKTLPTANGLKNVLPCRQVSTAKSEVWLYGVKLEKGKIPTDWTPAPEDYDSKLIAAQSEIKQTTDSIKASVSALDKSTVKSASLTINTDGIVMKAGKSTTDVANAIGSYFAVNQNAINLFSDKINVKGSMIVDGAITSTKIASKSINTAHLNGKIITADVISAGAITANAIKAGAVTTSAMSANSINGDRITAGTLDAAKIKAGSITASQIASGTITSSQIKTGGISAANIAAGAITTNHLATGSITADKIKAGSITSDMFRGNKITSLNNATTLDLQSGEITFNNIYATINQTKGSYKSQISLFSLDDKASTESSWSSTNVLAFNSTKLTSATRRTGSTVDMFPNFSLMTLYGEKIAFTGETSVSPGPNNAIIITTNSEGVDFINGLTNNSKGTWNYSMIMDFGTKAAISVPDIKLDGHFKSLTGILDDLCKKVGILWV
jgi:predicted  nucleic acid-binding Zn-ribbon protein